MKTRNFFKTLLLLVVLVVVGGLSQQAKAQSIVYEPYDFREVNADGDTLYYRITSDSEPYTVAVTRCHDSTYHKLPFPQLEHEVGQPGFAYPVYDYDSLINIPPTVTHDDVTYTVTAIDIEAFYYQKGMNVVNLPSTIETIDSGAFYLSSLAEINLQEGVQRINYGAFVNTAIREINLPQSLSHIGSYAFGNTAISRVDLPSGIDTLRYQTYAGCPIEHITFPEGLVVIEYHAFPGVNIDSLIFPSTLQYLGGNFADENEPEQYTSRCKYVEFRRGSDPLVLGYRCFRGCRNLETLIFSDNIISFGEECFSFSGVDTVVVPQNVRMIPNYCFYRCDSLRSVTLPENIDTIGALGFSDCSLLKSIVLPAGLKYIERRAFSPLNDSTGLEEIRVLSEVPPVLRSSNVFSQTRPITCTIPCGTLAAYQSYWGRAYRNFTFVEDCEAVEEHDGHEIRVYPNPTSDFLCIEGDFDIGSQLFIYDMTGRIVETAELTSNNASLNISHLPDGYYIVKVGDGNGRSYGVKICKQR